MSNASFFKSSDSFNVFFIKKKVALLKFFLVRILPLSKREAQNKLSQSNIT